MLLIWFLIFAILFVFLYFTILRKLPLTLIAKAISAQIEVKEQNGLFSFSSLNLKSPEFVLNVMSSRVSINPLGMIFSNMKLLTVAISKIEFNLISQIKPKQTVAKKEEPEKSKKNPESLLKEKINILLSYYLLRFFDINIKEIVIQMDNNTSKIETGLHVRYERTNVSNLIIELEDTNITIKSKRLVDFSKFGVNISVDLDVIYSAFFNPKMFLLNYEMKLLSIVMEGKSFTLNQCELGASFNPGDMNIKISPIKVTSFINLPHIFLDLKNLNGNVQIPLKEIPYLQIRPISAHFDELNIKIVSEHFLRLTQFNASIKNFENFDFELGLERLSLHYTSLDGVELFPLVKELRDPVWTPLRIKFAFPIGHGAINSVKLKLIMTDLAHVRLTSSNVEYSNKVVTFPLVQLCANKFPIAKLTNFGISSPDELYLTFTADNVVAHDHRVLKIGWFIKNILYGWYIIKPWASGNHYDSETIPFPIRVIIKRANLKIDDNPINKKLITLSSTFTQFLKEKSCMRYIFDAKVQQANLSDNQKKLADEKIEELYFQNFRELYKKEKFHKYILSMVLTNIDAKLDSRELGPGMETMLYKIDPTTAELHPNTTWDTLEGLKLNVRVGSFDCYMMKLKKPFMSGSNIAAEGTLILAEIAAEKMMLKTTVCQKEFIVPGTVTDIKLYCDVSANIGCFEWYFGGPAFKLMDDFADSIIALIPESGLDPSPPLRWWDQLRSIFRGRYNANASCIVTHMIGGTRLDDQENTLVVIAKGAKALVIEGNISCTTQCIDITRTVDGPLVAHLPNFMCEWELIWKSASDNPHKHLVIPDISQFNDPQYDTYKDFRATEYEWNFAFNFSHDKVLSPFVTVDIAHLMWIYDPMKNLYDGSPLNESYLQKLGVPKNMKRPKDYYFGKMPSTMRITLNKVPILSLRAFDHFPVKNYSINGSSIDATLINFDINMFFDMRTIGNVGMDISVRSSSTQFNATDLRVYSRFSSELSPTFMEIRDLMFTYKEDKINLNVDKIRIAANQFNVKYIKEYVEAVLHFFEKKAAENPQKAETPKPKPINMSADQSQPSPDFLAQLLQRRSEEKVITAQRAKENRIISQLNKSLLDNFTVEVANVTIPTVEILVESMQYDARILGIISLIAMKFNKDEKADLYCCQLTSESFSFMESGQLDEDGSETKDDEFIKIQAIKFQYYQRFIDQKYESHYEASIAYICLNVSSHDIALIKHFAQEIEPPDNKHEKEQQKPLPSAPSPSNDESSSFFDISIENCQGLIQDINKAPIGSLLVTAVNFKSDQKSAISENAILVQDLEIKDIRAGVLEPTVCQRWMSQVEANLNSPIIRFQAKMAPPVGGIPIINHLEINLDPTVVNYEASFFSVLIELVLSKEVKRPIFLKMSDCFQKPGVFLPHVLIDKSKLPLIEADTSKFMEENKSKELMLQTDKADEHMLLRYFKITSTKLNVSYHNAESKIPDINQFNGLFHEIRYQDFNATMETLIGRLISDISSDIIPQFLKHMIGLGKIGESEEAALNMWLQNDHDKQNDRQKLMLFGKNKKPTK